MKSRPLDEEKRKLVLTSQKNEITEHVIHKKLAQSTKDARTIAFFSGFQMTN